LTEDTCQIAEESTDDFVLLCVLHVLCGTNEQHRVPCGPTPSRVVARVLLRLLAVLDDVALSEQDLAQDRAPRRCAAEQELEVHAEVLELLLLRVAHDRARRLVLLERDALLVPAD